MSDKRKKNRRKRKILIIFTAVMLCIISLGLAFADNKNIDVEKINIDGNAEITIVHVSDTHFPKINVDSDTLIGHIRDANPSLIALTGDIIDRSSDGVPIAARYFIEQIKDIAPIFYVNGNHEQDNARAEEFYDFLEESGATVLLNRSVDITADKTGITIMGVSDSEYEPPRYAVGASGNYKILLLHRPDLWTEYFEDEVKPDLILSGHIHGGQIRLPLAGGLFSPDTGFFPKYDSGLYAKSGISLVVSRGLGNSIFPLRINNKPHLPVIRIG